MRRGFGLIWLGATMVVSAVVGILSYQAGLAAGLAARMPANAVVPYYYYAPHFFGFGLLPFLFLLLVLFLVFRGRRRWGPGAWGPGWGPGVWAGRGWGPGTGDPSRMPGAPQPPADDPLQDWPQRPSSEQPAPGRRQG